MGPAFAQHNMGRGGGGQQGVDYGGNGYGGNGYGQNVQDGPRHGGNGGGGGGGGGDRWNDPRDRRDGPGPNNDPGPNNGPGPFNGSNNDRRDGPGSNGPGPSGHSHGPGPGHGGPNPDDIATLSDAVSVFLSRGRINTMCTAASNSRAVQVETH
jgi:hypothetical protein